MSTVNNLLLMPTGHWRMHLHTDLSWLCAPSSGTGSTAQCCSGKKDFRRDSLGGVPRSVLPAQVPQATQVTLISGCNKSLPLRQPEHIRIVHSAEIFDVLQIHSLNNISTFLLPRALGIWIGRKSLEENPLYLLCTNKLSLYFKEYTGQVTCTWKKQSK